MHCAVWAICFPMFVDVITDFQVIVSCCLHYPAECGGSITAAIVLYSSVYGGKRLMDVNSSLCPNSGLGVGYFFLRLCFFLAPPPPFFLPHLYREHLQL